MYGFKCSFEPTLQMDQIRHQRVQRAFINAAFGSPLTRKLPNEILIEILSYLIDDVRRFALRSSERIRLTPRTGKIPLHRSSIWATHVLIDGVKYVKALSNFPLIGFYMIYNHRGSPTVNTVYTLQDHLGVRKLVFGNNANPPTNQNTDPGAWWYSKEWIDESRLWALSDGVKIRRIESGRFDEIKPQLLFPELILSTKLHSYCQIPLFTREGQRCRFVPLMMNGPDVTGYSFCWCKGSLIDIKVQRIGESYDIYRDADALLGDPIWGIGTLSGFMTNNNHYVFVGQAHDYLTVPYNETKVCVLDDKPQNIYLGHSVQGFQVPRIDGHQLLSLCGNIVSFAPLAGIRKIVPCQGEIPVFKRKIITGLLLEYFDGFRATLGHFRFDLAFAERQELNAPPEGFKSLYLGKANGKEPSSKDMPPFAVAITTSPPASRTREPEIDSREEIKLTDGDAMFRSDMLDFRMALSVSMS
ncbi:hypothetical protein QBC38DRAFT_501374 [Podospora fimiseda]|uniref:Uncharacterized protein n=1 Tax=Podospora fimiseda TaxID=252190 RepID=A0AAN7GRQ7_9PEZI|nr:hypothetical protein QBC38DRAFT_501374 [Podospora fimiseda]